jgi:chromosomal replication initiator protein
MVSRRVFQVFSLGLSGFLRYKKSILSGAKIRSQHPEIPGHIWGVFRAYKTPSRTRMQGSEIKQEIRQHLLKTFSESALERWYDPLVLNPGDNDRNIVVEFPHHFFGDWFAQSIQDVFEKHLHEYLGPGWVLVYNNSDVRATNSQARAETKSLDFPFGPEFTFDGFITNRKNYFPLVTAQEVAKKDEAVFNPFIITGESGSGKSHLLKAIANEISKWNGHEKIFLGTVEDLYNLYNTFYNGEVIEAQNNIFEYKYFFLDDLQDLSRYKNFQAELIVLFNFFYDHKKQMGFCCSDRIPVYDFLDPKLKSRLEWGLQVNLKKPDLDVRIKYIERTCAEKKITLNKDQIIDLARRFEDLRFLRGILLKIYAFMQYIHKDLTQKDLQRIIKQTTGGKAAPVKPETVLEVVADHFELDPAEVTGKARTGHIVKARQIAMFICRDLLNSSFPTLGRIFGGRDHSTALYAVKKIQQLQSVDKETKRTVETLKKKCLQAAESRAGD